MRENTVELNEITRTFGYIGVMSFGGPAAQIALMHRILVDEKRWLNERQFLNALNFCMLLPGPEAQQLATYSGWLLRGVGGGLIAGLLFIVPGALVLLGLSIAYVLFGETALLTGLFYGVKAAVLAVVLEALVRISKRVLKTPALFAVSLAAFVLIFFLQVPFPLIIAGAALLGYILGAVRPSAPLSPEDASPGATTIAPSLGASARTLVICLALWFAPLAALALWADPQSAFLDVGLFFSKMAVVTFGGAYAVLAYVAQQAVEIYGWLAPDEMLDGLGLAETTPGPLILVTQFVGFLAGFRGDTGMSPLFGGIFAALLTLWVTFVPCFTWIFLGAPYVERIGRSAALSSALQSITAAVVGVVLNLALWFTLHVLFGTVDEVHWGAVRLFVPELASLDLIAAGLALASALALVAYHMPLGWVLAGAALAGVAIGAISM